MGGGPGWELRVRPSAEPAEPAQPERPAELERPAEPVAEPGTLKGPKGPNVELGGPLRAPRAQM